MKNILTVILLLSTLIVSSQTLPERPEPPRLVNDFAGVLSPQEREALEQQLVRFNNETSTQIAVVTVKSLDGTSVSDYAFKLAEKWGIGQKGKDNGILILLKPKTGNEKGQVFIATGYGLEGAVPDAVANRIVDNEMIPHFRQNDYYGGLQQAVNTLMKLTKGEYTADEYLKKTQRKGNGIAAFIPFLIFIIFFLFFGKARRTQRSSLGGNIPFWVFLGMMGSGRDHSGHWDNFSGGGGDFGGGGFGGFGGGSFGGGGAGGSW
ncbi:MAG: TPM domain-containing protein [Chlorobi bacterium]|nr:TPM domain-containing protein [Chlorobiota bacterium]